MREPQGNVVATYPHEERFEEIHVLQRMLKEKGIPFTFHDDQGGHRIEYLYNDNKEKLSIIQTRYSYGSRQNLLEICDYGDHTFVMDVIGDEVEGYLTAKEVYARIAIQRRAAMVANHLIKYGGIHKEK